MTPQEKAKELVDKFSTNGYDWFLDETGLVISRKKYSALICVEEIMRYLPSSNGNPPNLQEYEGNKEWWLKVKQEINKL